MATGRAFIAIYPPTPVVELLSRLERDAPGVRWVPTHQLHVTLRFLGDHVDAERVDEHLRATFRHRPVEVHIGPAVDDFAREIIQIPVAGVESLAAAVDAALAPLVGPRRRPFAGHLTLGRSRQLAGRLPLVGDPVATSFTADSIELVASELTPDGARHERVGTYQLSESA
jgi:2'-5' RNA ligase